MYTKRARVRDIWLDYGSSRMMEATAGPDSRLVDIGQPNATPVEIPPPLDADQSDYSTPTSTQNGEIIETDSPFVFSNNLLRGVGSSKYPSDPAGYVAPFNRFTNGEELIEVRYIAGFVNNSGNDKFLDYTFDAPRAVNEVRSFFSLPALDGFVGYTSIFNLPPYHPVTNPTGNMYPRSSGRWRFFNSAGDLVHEINEQQIAIRSSFVRTHRFSTLFDVKRIQFHPLSYNIGLCELEAYPSVDGTAGVVPVAQPKPIPAWVPQGTESTTPMTLLPNLLTGALADHIDIKTGLEFPNGSSHIPAHLIDLDPDTYFNVINEVKPITFTLGSPITVKQVFISLKHIAGNQGAAADAYFRFYDRNKVLVSELDASTRPFLPNTGQTEDTYLTFTFEDTTGGDLAIGVKYVVLTPKASGQAFRWITQMQIL